MQFRYCKELKADHSDRDVRMDVSANGVLHQSMAQHGRASCTACQIQVRTNEWCAIVSDRLKQHAFGRLCASAQVELHEQANIVIDVTQLASHTGTHSLL